MQLYWSLPALPNTLHHSSHTRRSACESHPPKCYLCIRHACSSSSLLTDTSLKLSFKSAESRRQLEDQPLQHTQCAACQSGPAPSGQTVQVAEWKCIDSDSSHDKGQCRGSGPSAGPGPPPTRLSAGFSRAVRKRLTLAGSTHARPDLKTKSTEI